MSSDWGYTKGTGPHTWGDKYPDACGIRQSPIDIPTIDAINDPKLSQRPLRIVYPSTSEATVINTGYCWKVHVDGKGSELEGGPLQSLYRLEQFHFHWGRNEKVGSEHTVDGSMYAAEAHLVHWNCGKYSSIDEAVNQPDGLAVLGTFIKVGREHSEMCKITDLLESVRFKGEEVPLEDGFNMASLLPDSKAYWTYPGSLTTPPCFESVTWIVFKEPIEVSAGQLMKFRQLKSYCRCDGCPDDEFRGNIVENFRPPLPLGDRVVRECSS